MMTRMDVWKRLYGFFFFMIKTIEGRKEPEIFEASFKGECSCGCEITCHTDSSLSPWVDKKRFYHTNLPDDGGFVFRCANCGKSVNKTYKPYY